MGMEEIPHHRLSNEEHGHFQRALSLFLSADDASLSSEPPSPLFWLGVCLVAALHGTTQQLDEECQVGLEQKKRKDEG